MHFELDNEAVRHFIKIFPFTEKGNHDLPDPIQIATVAAILAPADGNPSDSIMDAVRLIADSKDALKQIRTFAAGDQMKWNSMTLAAAEEETGLSIRTVKKHASELGYKTDGDDIDKRAVSEIKERNKKRKLDRAKAGFKASHFKQKKRRVKKTP
jgi:hypothetical protein